VADWKIEKMKNWKIGKAETYKEVSEFQEKMFYI
jgi:hypothetical protein